MEFDTVAMKVKLDCAWNSSQRINFIKIAIDNVYGWFFFLISAFELYKNKIHAIDKPFSVALTYVASMM